MQTPKIPQNFRLEYSAGQIGEAVRSMGQQITSWAAKCEQEDGSELLTIPVLRGGIFFFADLVREIRHSVEIAPARAWAYEPDQFATQKLKVGINLDGVPAQGRHVLVVDDICDSGRTLKALCESIKAAGAKEVRSAVLIKRHVAEKIFEPDWVAFEYPGKEWFVGYGMDDRESWRNLPGIYIMNQQ